MNNSTAAAAQYAMALEVVQELVALTDEHDVVDRIFELMASLFGPTWQFWVSFQAGEPVEVYSWDGGESPPEAESTLENWEVLSGSYGKSAQGFWLALSQADETIGVLSLGGEWVAENLRFYLNTALGLAGVCALAVSNVRSVEAARAARSELATEREQLAIILRSLGEAVIATDEEERITNMNPVAERLLEVSLGASLGQPFGEICQIRHFETGAVRSDPVAAVLRNRGKDVYTDEGLLTNGSGRERRVVYSAGTMMDVEGRRRGAVFVCRDITEEHILREREKRLEKLESLSLMAGGIAHDFNNVLAVMMGNISLIDRSVRQREQGLREVLDDVGEALVTCRELCRQLLTFATGHVPVRRVESLGHQLLSIGKFSLRGTNCRLETSIATDLWPVDVDKTQISQLINNLLINAQQSMPDGGEITISAQNVSAENSAEQGLPAQPHIRVDIQDEGAGIPRENLSRIFEPFFTTRSEGTGLGLSTCMTIALSHGGDLRVESTLCEGSTFTLWLPVVKGEIDSAKALPASGPGLDSCPINPGRVLAMDDEPGVRTLLRRVFERNGWSITLTEDGAQTIEAHAEALRAGEPYDLLVVDLTVPGGIGGAAVLREVRRLQPDAKVIASSGYWSVEDAPGSKDAKFSGFLPKPYTLQEVMDTVRDVLVRS